MCIYLHICANIPEYIDIYIYVCVGFWPSNFYVRLHQPPKPPRWPPGRAKPLDGPPTMRRRLNFSCWARITSGALISTESAESYTTWQGTLLHAWINLGSCWISLCRTSRPGSCTCSRWARLWGSLSTSSFATDPKLLQMMKVLYYFRLCWFPRFARNTFVYMDIPVHFLVSYNICIEAPSILEFL